MVPEIASIAAFRVRFCPMILENAIRLVYGDTDDAVGPTLLPELRVIGRARFPATKVRGLDSHRHPTFEICYIAEGAVTWWALEERFDLRRGDVFFTRPEELHGGVDRMMHPCDLYWLHVTPQPATESLFDSLTEAGPRCFSCMEAGPLFAQMHEEQSSAAPFATLAAEATLLQLLVTVARARARQQIQRNERICSPTILAALEWMTARLGEPFAIQEAAAAVQMHPARFHERFLLEVGHTPAEWRVRQRIARARTLLSGRDATVTEVALSLGFATPQSFATAFKRYTGRTPTEYRMSVS